MAEFKKVDDLLLPSEEKEPKWKGFVLGLLMGLLVCCLIGATYYSVFQRDFPVDTKGFFTFNDTDGHWILQYNSIQMTYNETLELYSYKYNFCFKNPSD